MSQTNRETHGDWLFAKMAALYGARFADMWRGVDATEVRAEWTQALHDMRRDDLQRGIGALYHARFPPTLPEFLDLCRPPAPVPLAHQFPIEDNVARTDSATARVNLAGIARTISVRNQPGIEWARRIVETARTVAVPAQKLAMAEEAIRRFKSLNPPRKREPGDDDESPTAQFAAGGDR